MFGRRMGERIKDRQCLDGELHCLSFFCFFFALWTANRIVCPFLGFFNHATAESNTSMTIAAKAEAAISVSACRRSMGKPLARPISCEIHLPRAYLTFAELMSKRPRLFSVVATRLSIPHDVKRRLR